MHVPLFYRLVTSEAMPFAVDCKLLYPNIMSKILVTGANGFAGKHVVRELLSNNSSVVGICGSEMPPPEDISDPFYLTLDLNDQRQTNKIDFTDITGVIHLAGLTSVGASFDSPLDYMQTNLGIQINLFEAAIAQKASPRFIIVSSGTLYDPKATLPLNEQSPAVPNSPYAVSKLGQEQLAQYYITRGFECIIVRPFNHIGPGQSSGFIVPDLAQQIVDVTRGEKEEILVGNLEAERDYTDVRDIVRAYRLLIEKGRSGEIYNICSGIAVSGHEILDALAKVADCKPTIKQDPSKMRPSDTPVLYGSHDKLTADTGWQPEIQLETTLSDVIADWRSRN